jgi:hypothetical protein
MKDDNARKMFFCILLRFCVRGHGEKDHKAVLNTRQFIRIFAIGFVIFQRMPRYASKYKKPLPGHSPGGLYVDGFGFKRARQSNS